MKQSHGSNVFFSFYPNDHLNDVNLRVCHATAKGVWMDMVCLMAQGKPFGYLRIEPSTAGDPGPAPANVTPYATPTTQPPSRPSGVPSGTPTTRPSARASGVPGGEMKRDVVVSKSGSLEADLARLISQPEDLVRWAIQHLESNGVFSRDSSGVIYSRRMVRWFKLREERTLRAKLAYQKRMKEKGLEAPGRALKSGVAPGTPVAIPNSAAVGTPSGAPDGGANTKATTKDKTPPLTPPRSAGRGTGGLVPIAERIERSRTK